MKWIKEYLKFTGMLCHVPIKDLCNLYKNICISQFVHKFIAFLKHCMGISSLNSSQNVLNPYLAETNIFNGNMDENEMEFVNYDDDIKNKKY